MGELGRGGMGVVYSARDSILGRMVALKSLTPSLATPEGTTSRFLQEARVLASLTHPNIVQIYDIIEADGSLYIAMELVEGKNLAEHIQEKGPMPPAEAISLCLPLAQAMAYAHEKGVLHRDFKPHNVLLSHDGVSKITDFGLAKAEEAPQLTHTGAIMGSPAYMSPEQASGNVVSHLTDVYSFGVSLFELLSGRTPFSGSVVSILLQKTSEPAPLLREFVPEIPRELEELTAALLSREPAQRVPSMNDLVEHLRRLKQAY
jgi:serine/threonine-protein kinase